MQVRLKRVFTVAGVLTPISLLILVGYFLIHDDDSESATHRYSLYELGPDDPVSIEQAIAYVSSPQMGVGSMNDAEVQVTKRLAGIDYYGGGYRFQSSDAERWRALLTDETASIYGRMCAARFLLEIDDSAARTFLETQLASEDRRRSYNAAMAICFYVGRDRSREWGIQKMIESISDDRMIRKPENRAYSWCEEAECPEWDGADHMYAPFDHLCEALGCLECREAVPALIGALERHPNQSHVALALNYIGDTRARPALLQALKSGGDNTYLITALGEFGCTEAVPILLELLRDSGQSSNFTQGKTIIDSLADIGDKRAIRVLRGRMDSAP